MAFRSAVASAVLVITLTGCSQTWTKNLTRLGLRRDRSKSDIIKESIDNLSEQTADRKRDSSLLIWHDSWDAAQQAAELSGKPILVDFTGSDWCSWCIKLKKDVFETKMFKEWAVENVVLLELDYPRHSGQDEETREQNQKIKQKYNVTSFPTVLFLSSQGDVLGRSKYMQNPLIWIRHANSQLNN